MRGGESVFAGGLSVWLIVLLICGIVFIYIHTGDGKDPVSRAVKCGCYDRDRIRGGQWWRMLTVGFVHIQPLHLGMNLLSLYNLRSLENFFGHGWYALILLGSVIGGSILVYALSKTRFCVGLSGGLYGLLFSYLAILIRYHSLDGLRSIAITLIMNLAINFLPGIAWQAHLGGAITGFLLTQVFFLIA